MWQGGYAWQEGHVWWGVARGMYGGGMCGRRACVAGGHA